MMTSEELATVAQEVTSRCETPPRPGVTCTSIVIACVDTPGGLTVAVGSDAGGEAYIRAILTATIDWLRRR